MKPDETQHIYIEALRVVRALENAGYEAWLVGGFVRDTLLGRAVHDIDIATNARCSEGAPVFEAAGFTVHDTGIKHGTITVVADNVRAVDDACGAETATPAVFEVTTYRTDGTYSDGRHPDTVEFVTSIEEDLARRDFTMNAMAYHPERGLFDPYGGRTDLQAGIIRTVGNPRTRFKEDALRILRACRFMSQLGFSLDAQTYEAALSQKSLLRTISRERIYKELEGFVCGAHVHDALLATVDIVSFVLPELVAMKGFEQRTPYHIYDVLEHTAWVCQHSPATPLARWAALFHDMGKPAAAFAGPDGVGHFYGHAAISVELAEDIMRRLLFPTALRQALPVLVKRHDDVVPAEKRAVKRMLSRLNGDAELFRALCDLKRADALSQAPECAERVALADGLEAVLEEILTEGEAFTIANLAVNGHDVMALGVPAGPEVGRLLQAALDAVIDEREPNEHDALIALMAAELDATGA